MLGIERSQAKRVSRDLSAHQKQLRFMTALFGLLALVLVGGFMWLISR